jgi:nucleoside phosphorylase
MTSLDEIVSSEEWVDQLCTVEPKLLGVEMEAGGVCAAAASFGMKVAVLRSISDLSDPAKTDDIWRVRALKTSANLLEHLQWNEILNENKRKGEDK